MTRDGTFKSSVGSFAVFTLYLLAQLFWSKDEGEGHLANRADLHIGSVWPSNLPSSPTLWSSSPTSSLRMAPPQPVPEVVERRLSQLEGIWDIFEQKSLKAHKKTTKLLFDQG